MSGQVKNKQSGARDNIHLHSLSQDENYYRNEPSDFDDTFLLEPKKDTRLQSGFRKCWRVFGRTVIHIAPIAITIGVLTLTFKQKFWTPPSAETNTVLNLLQFAAQFHGSLIIMSLSAIILDLVSHSLKSKQGIPHGLLSSGFQLNSLYYLCSAEFWTGWKLRGNGDTLFVLTFLFTFILALGCQPSSAIAMIPRLQFWPVSEISPHNAMQYNAYIQADERSLYPAMLSGINAPANCTGKNASTSTLCPSNGIRDIMAADVLFERGGLDVQGSAVGPINLTVDSGWRRQITGSEPSIYREIYSTYTFRTLSKFLGTALDSFPVDLYYFSIPGSNIVNIQRIDNNMLARYDLALFSGDRKIPTKRPKVEVQCDGVGLDAASATFPQNFGSSGPELTVPSSQYRNLSGDTGSQTVNFTWIDIAQFENAEASLLAIFATPTIYDATTVVNSSSGSRDDHAFTFYPCTVKAGWEITNVYYDDSSGNALIYDYNPNDGSSDGIIQIDPDFAKYLDVPYIEGSINPDITNKSILRAIGEKCLVQNTMVNATILGTPLPDGNTHNIIRDQMRMLQCFQVTLSAYLADALSRIQESLPAYFVASGSLPDGYYYGPDYYYVHPLYDSNGVSGYPDGNYGLTQADFDDPSRFVEISMPLSRYGYGYGFTESKLIYVAAVILLIHVAVCIAHIVWISVRDPRADMGWKTLGELVAVLLRSPTAEHGIPLLRTDRNWRDRVAVRQMDDEDKALTRDKLSAPDTKEVRNRSNILMLRRIPASEAGSRS